MMTCNLWLSLLLGVAGMILAAPAVEAQARETQRAVPCWDRWERAFVASSDTAPDTELVVAITGPDGKIRYVPGFWDGNRTWRVRFRPDLVGTWRYRTKAQTAVSGLDEQTGTFECVPAPHDTSRFRKHGAVRVAESGTYLEHADGTPFFWLGDTVWNGALLSNSRDWEVFLQDRARKRFTAIQFVMTQWRTAYTNAEGETAFFGREKIEINPNFFRRMDARINAINDKGLLAVPVMLWAIRGDENPGYYLPEDQAIKLARYMVARYGAHHVAWILPGDGKYDGEHAERWKRIGRAVFNQPNHAPVLIHPGGMHWPYEPFYGEKWLSIIGYQSGHGDSPDTLRWIHSGPPAQFWQRKPARPFLNLEPPYEDHVAYQSKRPHPAYNVRRACYWSLLTTPTAGLTYGVHGVWSWEITPQVPLNHAGSGVAKPWHQAMSLPGSTHMQYLAEVFDSVPWWKLQPDQSLLVGQPGGDDPARFVAASRTDDGGAAVVYLPVGGEVKLNVSKLASGASPQWFDPRTGKWSAARAEGGTFRAPDTQDWVLVFKRP